MDVSRYDFSKDRYFIYKFILIFQSQDFYLGYIDTSMDDYHTFRNFYVRNFSILYVQDWVREVNMSRNHNRHDTWFVVNTGFFATKHCNRMEYFYVWYVLIFFFSTFTNCFDHNLELTHRDVEHSHICSLPHVECSVQKDNVNDSTRYDEQYECIMKLAILHFCYRLS